MSRGNRRDVDRARAQKRAEKNKGKFKQSGSNIISKKMNDADTMRRKQEAADRRKAEMAATTVAKSSHYAQMA